MPSPAVFPWRVRRIIPGSPAQRAGVARRHHHSLNGVRSSNLDKVRVFASTTARLTKTGQPLPQDRTLTFRRGEEKPFSATLKSGVFTPESAYGVWRTPEDKWDCMLDRKEKIGYIRLGPIETGVDLKVGDMLADLTKQGCRALILDLR